LRYPVGNGEGDGGNIRAIHSRRVQRRLLAWATNLVALHFLDPVKLMWPRALCLRFYDENEAIRLATTLKFTSLWDIIKGELSHLARVGVLVQSGQHSYS